MVNLSASTLKTLKLVIVLICLFTPPACAKQKNLSVWHLKQSHKIFGRNIEIYLNKSYFKWNCKDSNISAILKAPDWQVSLFNMRTKKIYKCKPSQFTSPLTETSKLFGGINWSKLPLKKVGQNNLSGVIIDHFRAGKTHSYLKRTDYWVSRNLPVNKSVILFMARLYNGPVGEGIPIKHLYLRPTANRPTNGINTSSIAKIKVPESTFTVPKNLSSVKTPNDVFSDKRHEKGLEWMIR